METRPEKVLTGDQLKEVAENLAALHYSMTLHEGPETPQDRTDRLAIRTVQLFLNELADSNPATRIVNLTLPSGVSTPVTIPPLVRPTTASPEDEERMNQLG